jgi:hypothetical protein
MRQRFTLVLSLLVVFSASAFGQSIQGYGFFAPGQKRTDDESFFNMHFGVGARFVHFVGGGFGFEAGMAGPRNNFKKMSAGTVSANYYYDLIRGEDPHHYHGNVQPFVTVGYTRTFGNGNGRNWVNLGGGITFWTGTFWAGKDNPQLGFTLEFRDQIGSEYSSTVHLWAIRVGIGIRGKIYD